MMMVVNIHEAKTHLSRLLSDVEQTHQKVRICRNGQAVADLVPITASQRDPLLQCKELQGIEIKYDVTAPLSEDEWPEGILI